MIFAKPESYAMVKGGDKCVLLDGCFDPLHLGHLKQIRKAKQVFPDHQIVVGVASDADVRQKGREPLFGQMTRCAIVDGVKGVDVTLAKDRPLHALIATLKPSVLVKGSDWEARLQPEVIAACAEHRVEMRFLNTAADSSTDRLRLWAAADADASLDRLEAFASNQSRPTFDTEYFTGAWRGEAPFTHDARKKIEGRHPKIVKELFDGLSVLDVGCGPGYFVRMLRELGMDAGGIDPSRDAVALSNGIADRVVHAGVADMPTKIAQLVICREVLEHVPVLEIAPMVQHLFRVARRFVYITTRHSSKGIFDAATDFDTDPTHITCLSQPFLRSLCVLNGGKRRRDLETKLDHQNKGRVLVYELQ